MYLLEVNIAIALFYAFYKLLLSSDTFFTWRRITLAVSIALSICLPLVDISYWETLQEPLKAISGVYGEVMLPELVVGMAAEPQEPIIIVCLKVVYLLVAASLLVRFMIQLVSIVRLSLRSEKRNIFGVDVRVLKDDLAPFSFFRLIFVNPSLHDEKELDEIITHERAHAEQWHSVDVILGELACVVFCYNPFMWLVKREIRNNLEFLADNRVLRGGYDTKSYQYHLLGLTYQKAAANLYNNFNVLPLKERIKMMNKKRTNGIGRAKYALLLPMVALMLIGCNINQKQTVTEDEQVKDTVETAQDVETVDSASTEEIVYKNVDKIPEFPGGDSALMQFLSKNVKYPEDAMKEKAEGSVVIQFVVQKDGTIGATNIVRKVHPSLDAEAERLVKSLPKFEPGLLNGNPVNVWFTIPITFKLQE